RVARPAPVDTLSRHITWAVDLPATSFLADRGRFLLPVLIRVMSSVAGITSGDDTFVYCGSGVHACHALVAMEVAGLEPGRLYPGSWSQWSADRQRPIALGDEPR